MVSAADHAENLRVVGFAGLNFEPPSKPQIHDPERDHGVASHHRHGLSFKFDRKSPSISGCKRVRNPTTRGVVFGHFIASFVRKTDEAGSDEIRRNTQQQAVNQANVSRTAGVPRNRRGSWAACAGSGGKGVIPNKPLERVLSGRLFLRLSFVWIFPVKHFPAPFGRLLVGAAQVVKKFLCLCFRHFLEARSAIHFPCDGIPQPLDVGFDSGARQFMHELVLIVLLISFGKTLEKRFHVCPQHVSNQRDRQHGFRVLSPNFLKHALKLRLCCIRLGGSIKTSIKPSNDLCIQALGSLVCGLAEPVVQTLRNPKRDADVAVIVVHGGNFPPKQCHRPLTPKLCHIHNALTTPKQCLTRSYQA